MARKAGRKKSSGNSEKSVGDPGREAAWSVALDRHAFWVALVVLVLFLVIFFHPVFFAGKGFQAADNEASLAHRPFVEEAFHSSGSLLDRYPLWTPYIFSGMPSYGSLIAAPYMSIRSLVMTPVPGVFKVLAYYLFLGLFMWLFLRRHGLGTVASLIGGTAYVFCAHIVTLVMFGHNSKIATLMFLPLVLLATDELWHRPSLRWTSILGLAVGMMIASTHVQIAYYIVLATGLYLVVANVYRLREGAGLGPIVKSWGYWIAGLVLGVAAAAVIVFPVREYAEHSIRGGTGGGLPYDYATNWSLHPLEMTTFFSPSFMGFGGPSYWGWMPFTDFPHYTGILVLFFAVLTLVLWPRERLNVYLGILALLSLLLSFGKHVPIFYNFMFDVFPYFNKFRVPSMILVLFQFAVAMLAALGVARAASLSDGEEKRRVLRVLWRLGGAFVVLVIALGGVVASGSVDDTIRSRLAERAASTYGLGPDQQGVFAAQQGTAVKSAARTDTLVVSLVLVAGLALLWARLKGRVSAGALLAGVLLLTFFDLWNVGHRPARYHPRARDETSFVATPAVRFLQDDPEPFRILPLTREGRDNNRYAYYRLSSILGYHPAKLKIYQDLVDEKGPVGISRPLTQGNFNIVSMLNMKYVLADQEIVVPDLETVHRGNQFVMLNKGYLPRMWFVDRVREIPDDDAHLRALADTTWRPGEEAFTFEDLGPLDPGEGGSAAVTRYEPREIHATVTSPGNSFLVISEVFYQPGWNARLDGDPVELHRVNYVLKGIVVPEGTHELVLRFDPPSFRRSIYVSLAAHGLIGLGLVVSVLPRLRRRNENTA